MMNTSHRLTSRSLAAVLLITVAGVLRAELSSEVQTQVSQIVRQGDSTALAGLARDNATQAGEIAQAALALAKEGLAIANRTVSFETPGAERPEGIVEPKTAADVALAALVIGQDIAGQSPQAALAIIEGALDIASARTVGVVAGDVAAEIARKALQVMKEPAVNALMEPSIYAKLTTLIVNLLPKAEQELFDSLRFAPTNVDPAGRVSPAD